MAAVCHRVAKDDRKFNNIGEDDDCDYGEDDNDNSWNETQNTNNRCCRISKHKQKEEQIVHIFKSYQILIQKLKHQQILWKK